MPPPDTGFTRRPDSAHKVRLQGACGALEDSTALPQRPQRALSNALFKHQTAALSLCMFKMIATA